MFPLGVYQLDTLCERHLCYIRCRGSSVVEQRTENPCVGSSTLPLGTQFSYLYSLFLTSADSPLPDFTTYATTYQF